MIRFLHGVKSSKLKLCFKIPRPGEFLAFFNSLKHHKKLKEVGPEMQADLLSLSSKGVNDIAIDFEYQFTRDLLTKRKRVFSI